MKLYTAADIDTHLAELAELMHACVQAGASVGYILPYSLDDATHFWRTQVQGAVASGGRLLLVEERAGRVAGAVQLDIDTPPNQPHRAEVRKLLVHPHCRRLGIARALMVELEAHARAAGRSLLTLDTRSGDHAEPLYASMAYCVAGRIPNYCRDTVSERLDATTVMFKVLE